jgi:hypothetical protein
MENKGGKAYLISTAKVRAFLPEVIDEVLREDAIFFICLRNRVVGIILSPGRVWDEIADYVPQIIDAGYTVHTPTTPPYGGKISHGFCIDLDDLVNPKIRPTREGERMRRHKGKSVDITDFLKQVEREVLQEEDEE